MNPAGTLLCGDDCDDSRYTVHPGLVEVCDELDNDCNGVVDEGVKRDLFVDGDRDGYGAGAAVASCGPVPGWAYLDGDCDDSHAGITPGAQRCVGSDYQICEAGSWSPSKPCGINTQCVAQPNGTGVCL